MKWICSQIGAREHYAIPRVLHRLGKLECLYTDIWAGTLWRTLGSFLRRPILSSRFHFDLTDAKVESFDLTTVVDSVFGGYLKKNPYDWFLYVGNDFGRSVVESLNGKNGINCKELIFFGYDTGFLEPAQWVKARGGKAIVCQMDPSRIEVNIVKEEEKCWPGWAKRSYQIPDSYFQRREKEWEAADLVMVNSEWTKNALVSQGVAVDKMIVIPLAYETEKNIQQISIGRRKRVDDHPSHLSSGCLFSSARPLRVLFLGQVILRKGIQYLIGAAELLQSEPVKFDVVGPIGISEEAVRAAPSNMTFHGSISRDKASKYFMNADLYVLPTLSDGFALTQLEAMAYGLPVITTLHCGKVVTDGVDGTIVPSRDAKALAEAVCSLIRDTEKLESMQRATEVKGVQFSMEVLGGHLKALENHLK